MSETPRLALPEMAQNQASKEVTYNEAVRRLDALVQASVLGVEPECPESIPEDGDAYIVTEGVGAWIDHDDEIAYYRSSAWMFLVPLPGWRVYDRQMGRWLTYDGLLGWVETYDALLVKIARETALSGGQVTYREIVGRQIQFPANFAGSQAAAGVAPSDAAGVTLTVYADAVVIGTVHFAQGETTATFATSEEESQQVTVGQVLTVVGPAVADAAFAQWAVTLVGQAT